MKNLNHVSSQLSHGVKRIFSINKLHIYEAEGISVSCNFNNKMKNINSIVNDDIHYTVVANLVIYVNNIK